MKFSAKTGVIFNPALGTLDFSSTPGFDIRNLYAVINITASTPVFAQGVAGFGISAISANGRILTLQAAVSGMNATDVLSVVYDEGNDNLSDLLALATGVSSPFGTQSGAPPGILIRATTTDELLKLLIASIRVLTRVTIADKSVNDGDIESMTQDELSSLNSIF